MKTRSGKVLFPVVAALSTSSPAPATPPPALCLVPIQVPTTVVSVVANVNINAVNELQSCPSGVGIWVLEKKEEDVHVYEPILDCNMDWSFDPWECQQQRVKWLFQYNRQSHIVHFDALDITVKEAVELLSKAMRVVGGTGQMKFNPKQGNLYVYRRKERKRWGEASRLADVVKSLHSKRASLTIKCKVF
jgi:hypothetical protein